jgi:hypothetical protein
MGFKFRKSVVPVEIKLLAGCVCGVALLCPNPAMGADIGVDTSLSGHELLHINVSGEIKPGDDIVFSRLAKGTKTIWLNLNSPGGDVDAAIGIGSEVRKHDGIVVTDGCYSSCVLIFAGGVIRCGAEACFGSDPNPVVGVHRIFFGDLPSGLTSDQVKGRYDAQLSRVRNYLAKMNVAPEFLSFMQSIEPDNIHILTRKELDRYGLKSKDVIYDERMIADRAEELGISSLEYRIREKRSYEECKNADVSSEEPTEAQRTMAAKTGMSLETMLRSECALAIHYGISVDLYRQRGAEVSDRCRQFSDQTQNNRCEIHFMMTGRAVP